ncbi:N-6 DNA methylase [Meiothermus ruber H328]|nr:N-6 DNA methylase [Meiothermus ruber H328]
MQPFGRCATKRTGVFQSSLELSPECNGLILACVQDGAQEAVCANPPKKASDAGWGKVEGKRVFNVP